MSSLLDWLSSQARQELRRFVDERIELALKLARDERRWLTVRETANYLGISEIAVRRRIGRGRIPTVRQGRSVLVDREALDRELDRGTWQTAATVVAPISKTGAARLSPPTPRTQED